MSSPDNLSRLPVTTDQNNSSRSSPESQTDTNENSPVGATPFPGINGMRNTCIYGVHYPWCAFIVGIHKCVARDIPITVQNIRARKLLPLHNSLVRPNLGIIGNQALGSVLSVLEQNGYLRAVDSLRWVATHQWNGLQERAKSDFEEWTSSQRRRHSTSSSKLSPTQEEFTNAPSAAPSAAPEVHPPLAHVNSSKSFTNLDTDSAPTVIGKFEESGVTYWKIKHQSNIQSVSLPLATGLSLLDLILSYEGAAASLAAAHAARRRRNHGRRRSTEDSDEDDVSDFQSLPVPRHSRGQRSEPSPKNPDKTAGTANLSSDTDTEDEPNPNKTKKPVLPSPPVMLLVTSAKEIPPQSDKPTGPPLSSPSGTPIPPTDDGYESGHYPELSPENSEEDYKPPEPKKLRNTTPRTTTSAQAPPHSLRSGTRFRHSTLYSNKKM
ncbi:hypothetical protein Pelo_2878 [Pelomyxa schiedti]|nr:hypothetical protein Pelo_2878 [Pelomyxa schiedti]